MKCTVCGKEFGEGVCCQNCGVDRVTGLGNYSGYDAPSGQKKARSKRTSKSCDSTNESLSSNTMVCYACGEIIPDNSKYCPYCSTELFVTCPKCGKTYSSQYGICNECGTNREAYLKQVEKENEEAYKKEQERLRKQREQERAEKAREEEKRRLKHEAYKLKEEIEKKSRIPIMVWSFLFAIVMFLFIIIGPNIITNASTAVFLVIGALCVYGIGLVFIDGSKENKIAKWKRDHSNDPRSNFL